MQAWVGLSHSIQSWWKSTWTSAPIPQLKAWIWFCSFFLFYDVYIVDRVGMIEGYRKSGWDHCFQIFSFSRIWEKGQKQEAAISSLPAASASITGDGKRPPDVPQACSELSGFNPQPQLLTPASYERDPRNQLKLWRSYPSHGRLVLSPQLQFWLPG